MAKKEESKADVKTYRITPVGDGRMFGWSVFDADGELIEESLQTFMSEADAEKNARGFVTGSDVIAVSRMTTVDKDDNAHIVYESGAVEDVKKFGATIKYAKPDQERPTSDDQPTPADRAVSEDLVSPAPNDGVSEAKEAAEARQAEHDAEEAKAEEKRLAKESK